MDFSDEQHVKKTILSMTGFSVLYCVGYRILRKFIGVNAEYDGRVLSFIHGLISSFVAIYYVALPYFNILEWSHPPFTLILSHSFGYFFYDFMWCIFHGETGLMRFHHTLTLVGLTYYAFKTRMHLACVYALGLTEITNPFLQIRWYLKYHQMRESFFFSIVEATQIILFLFIRVVLFSYYVYQIFVNVDYSHFNYQDKILSSLGLFVSYGLSYQMIGYIVHQLRKKKLKSN